MTATPATDESPYDPVDLTDGDPIRQLAEARDRCPVSQPRPGVFVVARHTDVKNTLRDQGTYSSEDSFVLEGGTRTADLPATPITQMDPPAHTALRARLRQWFAPAKLKQEEPRIREVVSDALSRLRPGQPIEVWSALSRPIPARTVYAFLGLPEKDWDQIQEWSDTIHDAFPQVPFDMPEMAALAGYLGELVAIRSADSAAGTGVLDGLVHPRPGEQPLTPTEIVMHCIQLITAGTETTGILITNLLYELLADRTRWQRIVDDRALIPRAIEESLRHDAPLQYVLRTATADREISGCPVPAGSRVVLSVQSANLDEDAWGADAAAFSLDRAPGQAALTTFGFGIHTCLGAPLARLETRLLIEALVERFPGMRLAPGYSWQPAPHVMVRRPARLDVIL